MENIIALYSENDITVILSGNGSYRIEWKENGITQSEEAESCSFVPSHSAITKVEKMIDLLSWVFLSKDSGVDEDFWIKNTPKWYEWLHKQESLLIDDVNMEINDFEDGIQTTIVNYIETY